MLFLMSFYMPEEMKFYRYVRQLFEAKVIQYKLESLLNNPIGYLEAEISSQNLAEHDEIFNRDKTDDTHQDYDAVPMESSENGEIQELDNLDLVKESKLKLKDFTESPVTLSTEGTTTVEDESTKTSVGPDIK